ncbi:hypothetical protein WME76_10580 [Sorangium sp. So ce119]|uniref:hypothetical protein n=1 Tax=Sorangium sp. So ce119 TaxID=3133279 RepID=UPI003F62548D
MIENGKGKYCSALACVVGLLASPAAWAQDPAPPPADPGAAAPPAETTAPAPPVEPTAIAPAPAPSGDAATAGTTAPVPPAPGTAEPVAEPNPEASPIASWFRFDADNYGLQVWAGASHKVGPLDLASDIYLATSGYAEFDIGPAFTLGPVIVNPMVGIGFDFINHLTATLVAPQLYLYVDVKPVYFESWNMMQFNSVFNEGTQNYYYSRHFLLFYPVDDFGLGPHLELNVDLNEIPGAAGTPADDTGLSSLQIGGVVGLNYGTGNKLLMYLGYETQEEGRYSTVTFQPVTGKLAGRFTFVHNF